MEIEKEWYRVKEVAEICELSQKAIYMHIKELPAYMVSYREKYKQPVVSIRKDAINFFKKSRDMQRRKRLHIYDDTREPECVHYDFCLNKAAHAGGDRKEVFFDCRSCNRMEIKEEL